MELCHRYSNRPDLTKPLVSVLDKIHTGTPPDDIDLVTVSGNQPEVWRMAERLSQSDVESMIDLYRGGSTGAELATKFNVSHSSVKRVLRQHGARKNQPRRDAG